MKSKMNWKQPIDFARIREKTGDDKLASTLFTLILVKARNAPGIVTFCDKIVELKRGQTIYGRNKWQPFFGTTSATTIDRALKRLEKLHNLVSNQREHTFTVVTVINYDVWVELGQPSGQPVNNRRSTGEQPVNTNKSVLKSVKKIGKKHTPSSEGLKVLETYNRLYGRELSSTRGFETNLAYWLEEYSLEDIEAAFKAGLRDNYWRDKITPVILLRQRNERGENVDWIGDLKNRVKAKRGPRELRADESYGPDGKIRRIGGDSE